jgi:hypothetical protein
MTHRGDLIKLRDAVEGAQEWLCVSRFTNAEHARAKEQLAYVIGAMNALIAQVQEPAPMTPVIDRPENEI